MAIVRCLELFSRFDGDRLTNNFYLVLDRGRNFPCRDLTSSRPYKTKAAAQTTQLSVMGGGPWLKEPRQDQIVHSRCFGYLKHVEFCNHYPVLTTACIWNPCIDTNWKKSRAFVGRILITILLSDTNINVSDWTLWIDAHRENQYTTMRWITTLHIRNAHTQSLPNHCLDCGVFDTKLGLHGVVLIIIFIVISFCNRKV